MIANGDFEDGLKGWRVVSGSAFRGQPVEAATLSAKDVVIDGAPLVRLGGDFWHTPAFPVGHSGEHLIRTVGKPFGVLESDVFTITDPFLAFRLGGSAAAGAVIQLRVPATAVQRSKDFRALDAADPDGFVAVLQASPDGSDILHETTWSLKGKLGKSLVGASAKVRLQVTGPGQHRLLADAIRLEPAPPPPFHPPLWGWADLHCHPMAQAGFGGLLAGHMHGPVEDLGSCIHEHGVNHSDPFPADRRDPRRGIPERRLAGDAGLVDGQARRRGAARVPRLAGLRRHDPHEGPPGLGEARLGGRPAVDGRADRAQRAASRRCRARRRAIAIRSSRRSRS